MAIIFISYAAIIDRCLLLILLIIHILLRHCHYFDAVYYFHYTLLILLAYTFMICFLSVAIITDYCHTYISLIANATDAADWWIHYIVLPPHFIFILFSSAIIDYWPLLISFDIDKLLPMADIISPLIDADIADTLSLLLLPPLITLPLADTLRPLFICQLIRCITLIFSIRFISIAIILYCHTCYLSPLPLLMDIGHCCRWCHTHLADAISLPPRFRYW